MNPPPQPPDQPPSLPSSPTVALAQARSPLPSVGHTTIVEPPAVEQISAGGKHIYVRRFSGVVVSSNKREEMQVYGSGGGGRIWAGGGYINPITISSRSFTKHEFWVRSHTGEDKSYQLYGDVPLMVGHYVTTVTVPYIGGEMLLAVVTYNSGEYYLVDNYDRLAFTPKFSWVAIGASPALLPVVIALIVSIPSTYSSYVKLSRAQGSPATYYIQGQLSEAGTATVVYGGILLAIGLYVARKFLKARMLARIKKSISTIAKASLNARRATPR